MIRWLHISDLHHGQRGHGGRWPELREHALVDLRTEVAARGKPDLLFFTGDLAFSGKDEEYEDVEATLDDIRHAIDCEPIILPVPGNHDLVRPAQKWPLTQLGLDSYNKLRPAIIDRNEEVHAAFQKLFAGYARWWAAYVKPKWDAAGIRYQHGLFPGDFRLAASINGIDLAVVGINSALVHHQDRGTSSDLIVEVTQCGFEFERWINKHEAAFLLMHHPQSWLEGKVQSTFKNSIHAKDRFVACLCGHMHHPETDIDGPRRWLQASSLFGLEHHGSDHEARVSGYAWGELRRIDAGKGRLFQWVRRYSDDGRFVSEAAASIEDGTDVVFRIKSPEPQVSVVVVCDDEALRIALANAIDTYADVSAVTEVDPGKPSSVDLTRIDRIVVILTDTTRPCATVTQCLARDSLVLKTPLRDGVDPDVLRDAAQLRNAATGALSCTGAPEAARLVRSWLTAARKRGGLIGPIATPTPALEPLEADTDASSRWLHIDAVSQTAKEHFELGRFEEATQVYQELLTNLETMASDTGERNERIAKARLNIAACAVSVDKVVEAEAALAGIDATGIAAATKARLAMSWANIGRPDKAREVLPSSEETDIRIAQQLISLREGKLPEDLDPSLRLEACDVMIAQGRVAEAAAAAVEVLNDLAD
jgi:hypothetical protein